MIKIKVQVLLVVLGVTVLAAACIPSKESDVPKASISKAEEKEYQSELDLIQPHAYSNVEGLTLEKASYLSIIGKRADGQYWDAIKKGAEQAVADINKMLGYEGKDKVKVTYSGPTNSNDVDEQVNILDEELARYPVALSISTVDAKACEVQFDLAAESDIPIVAFDSGSDYQGLMSMVGTDNDSSARAAADRLVEAMGHEGEIVVFAQDSKSKTTLERESAFMDQIAQYHPGASVVHVYRLDQLAQMQQQLADEINAGTYVNGEGAALGQPLTDEQKVTAENVTNEDIVAYIFAKYPNAKGCYGTSGESTMLAVSGIGEIEDADVAVVGFDADDKELKALADGKIDGLIVQNPFGMGYAAVIANARASLKIGNEAIVHTGHTWVTKDNMEKEEIQKLLY